MYGRVRTDNMSGTTLGKDLVSVEYQVGGVPAQIENGNVVLVGALKAGEREIRIATAPAANSPLSDIALIASEEVDKRETRNGLGDFINRAGDISRAYRVAPSKQTFGISKECFSNPAATFTVGNVVELTAGTKLNTAASATANTTQVGKILSVENTFIVVETN